MNYECYHLKHDIAGRYLPNNPMHRMQKAAAFFDDSGFSPSVGNGGRAAGTF